MTDARTNILLITCDQLRHDWLGCRGADWVHTPNIDALAGRGMVFTQCSSNSPICTPARIALATGQMPHQVGSLDNNSYLRFSDRTYYQQLRDAGYRVGCVGKLDLAKPELECGNGALPRTFAWGFTHPVELLGTMDSVRRPPNPDRQVPESLTPRLAPEILARHADGLPDPGCPYGRWLDENDMYETFLADLLACKGSDWLDRHAHVSDLKEEYYEDRYIASRSVKWLEEIPKDRPWHLFVSFVGPHDPFNAPEPYASQFAGAAMPEPIPPAGEGKPAWIRKRAANTGDVSRETILRNRRQYAARIAAIDKGIGELMDQLEAIGQAENTVVILTADHGELLFDHGLMAKHCAYETSMRIPLIAAGPGVARGQSHALVELIDVGSTICDLAGAPRTDPVDAESFTAVLAEPARAHRSECVCIEDAYRAIRTDRWKYIVSLNDTNELYDLQEDPTEQHNVLAENRDIAAQLHTRLTNRLMHRGCRR
ncbi:MAG: sulfatase [Phycisphaerae bacterium]